MLLRALHNSVFLLLYVGGMDCCVNCVCLYVKLHRWNAMCAGVCVCVACIPAVSSNFIVPIRRFSDISSSSSAQAYTHILAEGHHEVIPEFHYCHINVQA